MLLHATTGTLLPGKRGLLSSLGVGIIETISGAPWCREVTGISTSPGQDECILGIVGNNHLGLAQTRTRVGVANAGTSARLHKEGP